MSVIMNRDKSLHERLLEQVIKADKPFLEQCLSEAICWKSGESMPPETIEVEPGDFALTHCTIEFNFHRYSSTYKLKLSGVNPENGNLIYSVQEIYR